MGGAGRAAFVVLSLLLAGGAARAEDVGVRCDEDAAELRGALEHEAHNAGTWNTVWRWTFTGAAVGSAVVAYIDPVHSMQAGLYVSAAKSGIAALSRWIMPLHVDVPAPTGDACTDLAALRKALTRVAKKERGLFFMTHIGGIVLNGVGAFIVYRESGAGQAALNAGIGYPVGLVSNYTMPRAAWHRWRDRTWTVESVGILPTRGGAFVGLGGAF